jgi:deoxyhypusine synthase
VSTQLPLDHDGGHQASCFEAAMCGGDLSGGTLKEASCWGKVELEFEQMVYTEGTRRTPLPVGHAYHRGHWKTRAARRWFGLLEPVADG